ncbi:glycosyltransferase family 39 protein [Cohnella suwonensis]|uniref:Glycosyltransferase family 39 protein n=1 Tax=Cohnella suwonensis TaxID=696072 RepID=A0ABW0LTC0_9BACL
MILPIRLLSAAGVFFFATTLVSSFASAASRFGSVWKPIVALMAACAMLYLVYRASKRLSATTFLIVFLSAGFAVRMAWVLWNPATPQSDFLFMYNAAQAAASGDYSFGSSAYYSSFPYQFGFTMYEAAVIKLFGDYSLLALKFLNVLYGIGIAAVLYAAASKTFNESCGRIAALFYLFYLPNILMSSVLTNQHLSTLLFLLGCLLLLRGPDSTTSRSLLAGLLIGLSQLVRPIGIIYLAGIVLFMLPGLGRKFRVSPRGTEAIAASARLVGVFVVFYAVQFLASTTLMSTGVSQSPLSGGDRYWKFMVGLNAETNGVWNADDARYANGFPFGEERHRAELKRIKERLADKPEVAALMGRKLVLMWGSADSSAYWSLQGLNEWRLERMLSKWEGPMYILVNAFGLVALIALWRTRRYPASSLYLLLLLLYAGAHLLIEIQTRYRLDLLPVAIVLQSYGAYLACEWANAWTIGKRRSRRGMESDHSYLTQSFTENF